MTNEKDTINLLRESIISVQENLLNEILRFLNISEISEEKYQQLFAKMNESNIELFKISKALEAQEIIDHVFKNKIGE